MSLQKILLKIAIFVRKYASKSKFLWSKIQKLQNILLKNKLRNYLMQSNVSSEELAKRSPETKKVGINLIGYAKAESGLGYSLRLMGKSLETTSIPWTMYNFETLNPARKNDNTFQHKITNTAPYRYSIFHINAEQMPLAYEYILRDAWDAYRIGVWYWELPAFPDQWLDRFQYVDELWVFSRFIQECLQKKAPCPVIYITPSMILETPPPLAREHFHLPENDFLFLTMYDTSSVQTRKNPMATIKAFQQAFPNNQKGVGLILKINNAHLKQQEVMTLKKLTKENSNIYFIEEILPRQKLDQLYQMSDAIVSLHRSEGLGYLCLEGMYFGKPVIATNWSGNIDFMDHDNSCLVDYDLIPVENSAGPYKIDHTDQIWAEAKVEHAAQYMKRLYEDKEYREKIEKNAYSSIRTKYTPEISGKQMQERIQYLEEHELYNKKSINTIKK
ncbi:MAG TPA: glycosyltransferase family 4 protein [Planctomycetota bacterium]|nr:glycosyltransferase family 4 protein [Planctomycetota bacterium]